MPLPSKKYYSLTNLVKRWGVEEEDIKYLFQRYSRFSYQVGGFGIGLNIVKLICDEYDINITASSLIKKGTKMELRW